jgi:hypothetical protein
MVNTVTTTKNKMNYLKAFLPYLFGNKVGKPFLFSLPEKSRWEEFSFEEKLSFHALSLTLNEYLGTLNWLQFSKKEIFHIINFHQFLSQKNLQKILDFYSQDWIFFKEAKSALALNRDSLQALIDFKNEELTLLALMPSDRSKRGRLLIRKVDGKFVVNSQGHIWSIPILAHTHRGLSFNHSNGHTPCGIYSIDGVMPEANNQLEFGKFRRLIVNFLKPEEGQEYFNRMPQSHWNLNWWKQSMLANFLGRSLLRIHGTGRKNFNIFSSYYPFVPTSGCLATMETGRFGERIAHQRQLLDVLMQAQGLSPVYENELKIHGLLYVVEFDGSLSALEFKV